jgi:hypothetical protein
MTKAIYRGHAVVANDNSGKPAIVTHDAVYRGARHDPSMPPKAANQNRKTRITYRGAKAA